MLEDYSTIRDRLLEIPERIAPAIEDGKSRHALNRIGQKVAGNEFCLVVAGQFKRGKTTFINSLLGEDLLPVAIIPLTSIITEISYGDSLSIEVFFNDGAVRKIPPTELEEYVTEKHNPRNVKDVRIVEVRHPSAYLKNGVRIIDTPGVASVHSHNTELTYSYLPNADAAIFLVSVDPPITEAEFHFLNDLKEFAARLFFVQNKIDMVGPDDRRESLEFTRSVIEDQIGLEDVTIFPLSAKRALEGKLANDRNRVEESGLPDFERMLERFLMEEKGQVLLDSAAHKIRNVIAQESFSAKLMQKTIDEPLANLESKIGRFEKAEKSIAQERRDSHHLVRAETADLVAGMLIPDLETLKTEKTAALVRGVDDHYGSLGPVGNRELAREMNQLVHERIHDTFDRFLTEEESRLRGRLEELLGRLVDRTNRTISDIIALSSSIFEIEVAPFVIDDSLVKAAGFDFKIDEDVKVSLEYITESATYLLPRPLAHRLILRGARARMKKQVDQHCGRMRHDFVERIEASVESFRAQLDETVDATLDGIRGALLSGRRRQEESERGALADSAHLENKLRIMEEALRELDSMEMNRILSPEA